MIIRKPYAFLIKYFRKIHIALIVIGLFVFYKSIRTVAFLNKFFIDRVYDDYGDPITQHITSLFKLSVLFMAIGSIAILFLLLHKRKPWKLYLIPSILYTILYFNLGIVQGIFNAYTKTINVSDLRLCKDILVMTIIAQLPAMAIFIMRVLGVDVKSFNFREDIEDLELSEEDKEEIEVGLNIDIYTFIRFGRKMKRYAGYFYEEHKKLCKYGAIIIAILLLRNIYGFIFVDNRVYRQGQTYNIDNYSMKVTNAWLSDKDGQGNIISQTSNFLVVEYEIKNNVGARNLNTSYFHIKAGNKDFTTTETIYAKEFEDLGQAYKKVTKIKRDETAKFIIIYKVGKKYDTSRFVMYYQEQQGKYKLRKMRLNVENISKMEKAKTYKQGDFFDIDIYKLKDSIAFDEFKITETADYRINECRFTNCEVHALELSAPNGYKIMSLDFASDNMESKNMIDFLDKYGKIEYKDSSGKLKSIDKITFMIKKNYLGKTLYIKIPNNIIESDYIAIKIITRNKVYNCMLT